MEDIINKLPSSIIFFTIAIIILLIASVQKNNNFFNITYVIKKHFEIFGGNILAITTFFIVPLLLAIGIAKEKVVSKDILSIVSLIITIFLSFFFALIGVLTSNNNSSNDSKKIVINETFNTVVFECTLSIILLLCIFVTIFLDTYKLNVFTFFMSLLIYYLFFIITINIFIIIKRISKIFK